MNDVQIGPWNLVFDMRTDDAPDISVLFMVKGFPTPDAARTFRQTQMERPRTFFQQEVEYKLHDISIVYGSISLVLTYQLLEIEKVKIV